MAVRENHRIPWTADDYALLRRLVDEGMRVRAIAANMGRTQGAIEFKVAQLGLSLKRAN
jgi:hypothetical protein